MEFNKNTKQRQIILDILSNAKEPQTAKDIYIKASSIIPNIAQTTVYRNIDSLFASEIISRYRLDKDQYSYKLNANNEHSHYLLCKKCGKLTNFKTCPITELENSILKETGFSVINHSIELSGYCKKCKHK